MATVFEVLIGFCAVLTALVAFNQPSICQKLVLRHLRGAICQADHPGDAQILRVHAGNYPGVQLVGSLEDEAHTGSATHVPLWCLAERTSGDHRITLLFTPRAIQQFKTLICREMNCCRRIIHEICHISLS